MTRTKNENTESKYCYVDNKLVIDGKNTNKPVTYIDWVDIGNFTNFGYLTNYTQFNKSFELFIRSLQAHFEHIFSEIQRITVLVENLEAEKNKN